MARWILAGLAVLTLAALVTVLVLMRSTSQPSAARPASVAAAGDDTSAAAERPTAAAPEAALADGGADPADARTAIDPVDPASAEGAQLLDRTIEVGLRRAAAGCDDRSLAPDLSLELSLRVVIRGGMVSTRDVVMTSSEVGVRAVEDCVVEAIRNVRWRDDRLPDLDEAQTLSIRLRALRKYLHPDEQATLPPRRPSGGDAGPSRPAGP
jgi:hypothetical protein